MTDFSDIKIAGPHDRMAILKVLARNYQENPIAPISWPKVEKLVDTLIQPDQDPMRGFIGLIEGKEIEATAAFMLWDWWFSDELYLQEMWTYVVPEYRRSTHAKHLYEWGKKLADDFVIPVMFGVLTTKRLAAKVRLAQRTIPQIGASFMYPTQPAEAFNQREFSKG